MQQTNRNKPAPGVLNGLKIVIASGAVAGAVGIWSVLAGNAMTNTDLQAQDQGNNDLAQLPTLVPLAEVQNNAITAVVDPTTGLRSVGSPTQGAAIQAPVVQTVIVAAPSSGGGSRPAARTRSSRRRK